MQNIPILEKLTTCIIGQMPTFAQNSAIFLSSSSTHCLMCVLTIHIGSCKSNITVNRFNIPVLELGNPTAMKC